MTMTKSYIVNLINEFVKKRHEQGYDDEYHFSDELIEQCVDMANKMIVVPIVRAVDDEFGTGIAFDYYGDKLIVEISVVDDEISGYTSCNDEQESIFVFEGETDAVNFWNVIVGGNAHN